MSFMFIFDCHFFPTCNLTRLFVIFLGIQRISFEVRTAVELRLDQYSFGVHSGNLGFILRSFELRYSFLGKLGILVTKVNLVRDNCICGVGGGRRPIFYFYFAHSNLSFKFIRVFPY